MCWAHGCELRIDKNVGCVPYRCHTLLCQMRRSGVNLVCGGGENDFGGALKACVSIDDSDTSGHGTDSSQKVGDGAC